MRSRLGASLTGLSAAAAADADFFLSIAQSLLAGRVLAPVAGADAADVRSFVEHATAAEGALGVRIFDTPRETEFSQFTPRRHYAGDAVLERYFRAMPNGASSGSTSRSELTDLG